MQASDFDFFLPPELIAPYPAPARDGSALMVFGRTGIDGLGQGGPPIAAKMSRFSALGEFLPPRSLLVVNETRVMPARLLGRRATGGRVEVLLLARAGAPAAGTESAEELWDAMARGLGRAGGVGGEVVFARNLRARIVSRGDAGAVRVLLRATEGRTVAQMIEQVGEVPIPPYILAARQGRAAEEPGSSGDGGDTNDDTGVVVGAPAEDRERYQTVYASVPGAVAAPTAGLHFTHELFARLRAQGHDIVPLTLHVGPGTFRPVRVEDVDEHPMDAEPYTIPDETAQAIEDARRTDRAIVAVGTTVVRALEAAAREGDGRVRAGDASTALFLRPGAEFRVVTDLITNFHLPRSTLLMLVAAFAGRARTLAAYEFAIARRLRFYSYGDAMFIRGTP